MTSCPVQISSFRWHHSLKCVGSYSSPSWAAAACTHWSDRWEQRRGDFIDSLNEMWSATGWQREREGEWGRICEHTRCPLWTAESKTIWQSLAATVVWQTKMFSHYHHHHVHILVQRCLLPSNRVIELFQGVWTSWAFTPEIYGIPLQNKSSQRQP